MNVSVLEKCIGKIPDYPKKGILFYDFLPLIYNSDALLLATNMFEKKLKKYNFDKFAAIDARGFLFGGVLCERFKKGITLIRKKGKIPGKKKIKINYELEYGTDSLEINPDLSKGKFILVDDLLATGGTASAAEKLISKAGGEVVCFISLIELSFLKGRNAVSAPCESLIKYET
ncbi:adenine phosphoribosyltransferase [Alphaproteobacteria bacterium]|nr:adenine phosphoribosyltransferase [Alphaproteobacteria bacterium]|tara:strand:+ start:89 stop:610 length:522 start_codon:yes stop_codon:yes gene_type:complete